eukprot:EG_transcript_976
MKGSGGVPPGLIAPNRTIAALSLHVPRPLPLRWAVWPWGLLYVSLALAFLFPAPLLSALGLEPIMATADHVHTFLLFGAPVILTLHLLVLLVGFWNVSVGCALHYRPAQAVEAASHVLVTPQPHKGRAVLLPLQRGEPDTATEAFVPPKHIDPDPNASEGRLHFHYQDRRYEYLPGRQVFVRRAFCHRMTFGQYRRLDGHSASEAALDCLRELYGHNHLRIPIPTFRRLLQEHMLAPFFVFQMFCVVLWCLGEYWHYSLFTGVMLVLFECAMVAQRLRSLQELRAMEAPVVPVVVYRHARWGTIPSDQLVPGDVLLITRNVHGESLPCDLLLLEGQCVVTEALLTGEAVPLMKESIERTDAEEVLDLKAHRRHVLFAGTKLLTSTASSRPRFPGLPSDGCVGVVLRTGYETAQGKLIRTIVHTADRVSANSKEAFLFIGVLLCFAVVAAGYVLHRGLADPKRSRYKIWLDCSLILTSVVPPELPLELSLAVNTSLIALHKLGVFCTEPFRIPFAGALDTCCFDKTGTLTDDTMTLRGVAGLPTGVQGVPLEAQYVLAGCHALVHVDGTTLGDSMEKAGLAGVGWAARTTDVVQALHSAEALHIHQRFPFNSTLKRMSSLVITQRDDKFALAKGAPEVMRGLFTAVPPDYDRTALALMHDGYRVIALGCKSLPRAVRPAALKAMRREEAEAGLTFAGFAVFECPIKAGTPQAVAALRGASHRVLMITGDNELTAWHVAAATGMARGPPAFLRWGDAGAYWVDQNEALLPPTAAGHALCVSGGPLASALQADPAWLRTVLPRAVVFARCSPDQKEFLLTELKGRGCTTLMCGDGTNDMGALRQAHVGVALLTTTVEYVDMGPGPEAPPRTGGGPQPRSRRSKNATRPAGRRTEEPAGWDTASNGLAPVVRLGDASIASPFTSKNPSILCTVDIIRMGRCTLVTTLQMYKILAVNCLVSAYGMSVLMLDGVKFGDTQMMVNGVLLAVCFLFISRSKPLEELAPLRPESRVFSPYILLSIFGQFAVNLWALITVVELVHRQDPGLRGQAVDLDAKFSPTLMNTAVFLITSLSSVVTFGNNYQGWPWMSSLHQNRLLFGALASMGLLVALLLAEVSPALNQYMELVPLPEGPLRPALARTMALNAAGVVAWEQALRFAFQRTPH